MTFSSEKQDKKKIISFYMRKDNCYYIKYLDGSESFYESSNKSEEEDIKKLMMEQAIERQNAFDIESLSYLKSLTLLGGTLAVAGLCISNMYDMTALFFISSFVLAVDLYKNRVYSKKLKELKKYKIFLELSNDLKTINNSEFLKCVEFENIYQKNFDINSLDEYSYRDVETIYETYKNREVNK